MSAEDLAQMIAIKRWADQGLYQTISRNTEAHLGNERDVLVRILDHIHAVDVIFQHHLVGEPHSYQAARSQTPPDIESLAQANAEIGAWYAAYVAGLSEAALDNMVAFTFTSGKPARMRRRDMLMHVCLHGTYHRGNAGAVLQLKGVAPGRDSVTDYLMDAA